MQHRVDAVVAAVAAERWGTFPDRLPRSAGASRSLIKRRIDENRWVRYAEGSLGFPDWPPSFERSLWLALHAAREGAQVGPMSAAANYGFAGFPKNRLDVLVPHGTTHTNPFAAVVQTRRMPATVWFNGFPMPSRERVLCDLARKVGPKRLGHAYDDQLVKGTIIPARFERHFVELAVPGWPGLAVVGRMLAERGAGYVPTRSDIERELRAIAVSLPGVTVRFEVQIGDRAELPQSVDCVIEDPKKLILEVDGRAYHQRVKEMARDRQRDRRASSLGYPTFRFLYGEVVADREAVRDEILRYLVS